MTMSDSRQLVGTTKVSANLDAPTDAEIDAIRRAGKAMVAHKKEVAALADQISGMEWGSGNRAVKGNTFTPQTRQALAEFCRVTRANPQRHVDILGGGPYLNAEYWAERMSSHPMFVRYEQREIGPAAEQEIRDRAKRHLELANSLEEAGRKQEALDRRVKAIDLEEEADEMRAARRQWNPRQSAISVVETTVYRFINATPLEKIESGEITDFDQYIVEVKECNWAGGMGREFADKKKYDPIGDMEPSKTARTRSMRRAAVRAFSAWMEEYDSQIRRAEEYVEAEFEILDTDQMEMSHATVVGVHSGEAESGDATQARQIPQRGQPAPEPTPEPREEEEPVDTFDRDDARKRLFATLNAFGIKGDARKDWAEENGFNRSTKNWSEEDYDRAIDLLMDPLMEEVNQLSEQAEVDINDVSLALLGKDKPEYAKDFMKIRNALRDSVAVDEDDAPSLEGEL